MKLNKKLVALAAAGALTATALPAMAFENEFHGTYTLKSFLSNYERGNAGLLIPTNATAAGGGGTAGNVTGNTTANLRMNNYFEQRARLQYIAKASDDLKLVTHFEIDSVFGDRAQGDTFRNYGGAIESDAVNLETKSVYLDFRIPSTPVRVKAGIQPFKDQLKGILADFDGAGVVTTTKLGAATLNVGYFRGYDGEFGGKLQSGGAGPGQNATTPNVLGNQNLDLGAVEFSYALNKDTKLGALYYIYGDGRSSGTPSNTAGYNYAGVQDSATMIHTFGLTGETKVGPVTLSGFAAYQAGVLKGIYGTNDSAYLNAWAANVAAKAAVGPGTLHSAFLYTSGNNDQANGGKSRHLTGWVGYMQSQDGWAANAINSYNESGMLLLNRNAASQGTTTESAVAYSSSNGTNPATAQGMYMYTIGYDLNITPKFFFNPNAGFLWAAKNNSLKPKDGTKQNASNFQAAEFNFETGYKMYDNLTAKIQAAYMVLGGYYKNGGYVNGGATNKDPEDPYTARVVLSYAF